MERLKIATAIAALILLFNGGAAVLTGAGLGWFAQSCAAACLGHVAFFIVWGILGLASGVFVFFKKRWALLCGSLFFLFQALAIRTSEFAYNLDIGVTFFISVSSGGSVVSFNLIACAGLAVLLSKVFRPAQARRAAGSRAGVES